MQRARCEGRECKERGAKGEVRDAGCNAQGARAKGGLLNVVFAADELAINSMIQLILGWLYPSALWEIFVVVVIYIQTFRGALRYAMRKGSRCKERGARKRCEVQGAMCKGR